MNESKVFLPVALPAMRRAVVFLVGLCVLMPVIPSDVVRADDTPAEQAAKEIADAREQANAAADAYFDSESRLDSLGIEAQALEAEVADLEGQVADLTVQVDDLGRQVEEFQAAGGEERPDLSDNIAFTFGSGLGAEAQPPLTQVEATCLGREVYGRVDTDTLVAFAFVENPSDDLLLQFINVLFVATGACDLDMERLGSA